MTRRVTLSTIIVLYCAAFGYLFFWTTQGLAQSRPISLPQVKGASTDATITLANAEPTPTPTPLATPKLTAYPSVLPAASSHVLAQQYVLFDVDSGRAIVKSSDVLPPVPIASTTKLMTAHLASKYGNLDDITIVSYDAAHQDSAGSMMGIHQNEKISIRNLLDGMLLVSGNDAAHAVAEYIGGILLDNPSASAADKTARFVTEMNAEAARLYMTQTHYMDPAGFNDEGRSTALDLAKIASIDLADPLIQPIMNTPGFITIYSKSGYRYDLHDSDRLISDAPYAGTIGGKTGFTYEAGHCLVTGAKQGGHTLIAVILHTNSDDTNASANEARKLLDYGFNNTVWQ